MNWFRSRPWGWARDRAAGPLFRRKTGLFCRAMIAGSCSLPNLLPSASPGGKLKMKHAFYPRLGCTRPRTFAPDGDHQPRRLRGRPGNRRHDRGVRRSQLHRARRRRQDRAALQGRSAVDRRRRVSSRQQGSDRALHHAGRQGGGPRPCVSAQGRSGAPPVVAWSALRCGVVRPPLWRGLETNPQTGVVSRPIPNRDGCAPFRRFLQPGLRERKRDAAQNSCRTSRDPTPISACSETTCSPLSANSSDVRTARSPKLPSCNYRASRTGPFLPSAISMAMASQTQRSSITAWISRRRHASFTVEAGRR
jgi:hypothetical protein